VWTTCRVQTVKLGVHILTISVQTGQLTSFGSGYQIWPPLFCKLCFCEFISCVQKSRVTFTMVPRTQWDPKKSSLLRFHSLPNETLFVRQDRAVGARRPAGRRSNRTSATADCTLQGQTMPMTREIGIASVLGCDDLWSGAKNAYVVAVGKFKRNHTASYARRTSTL
jgi:hypothetical protein